MINEEVRHSTQLKMMIMYIACSQKRSENFRNMSTIPPQSCQPTDLGQNCQRDPPILFIPVHHSLLARGCILFRHAYNTRVEQ